MKLITVDGRIWDLKYLKNKEIVTVKNMTSVHNYPGFIGSKVYQNSTSSDVYELNFAIHKSQYVSFKESLKKFLINEDDAIESQEYGLITHLILVHNDWGAIKGMIDGDVKYDTSSEADIMVSCTFVEHIDENTEAKTDIEVENTEANNDLDSATDTGELDEFDKPALLKMLEKFNEIYDKVQNSAVVAALNDLEHAINQATLGYQAVMNATKKVLSLPANITNNVRGKLDFFQKQAAAIKAIPRNTFNMTRFNVRCLALNLGFSNRTPFVSKEAERARSGIKTAPIE